MLLWLSHNPRGKETQDRKIQGSLKKKRILGHFSTWVPYASYFASSRLSLQTCKMRIITSCYWKGETSSRPKAENDVWRTTHLSPSPLLFPCEAFRKHFSSPISAEFYFICHFSPTQVAFLSSLRFMITSNLISTVNLIKVPLAAFSPRSLMRLWDKTQ